ncbi:hypothetical protein DFH09DRAFT_1094693 [Mycena vulgaris]|nr:hypothetical protein DFH09DRAFT_1094693 [Mycena vulgaris]
MRAPGVEPVVGRHANLSCPSGLYPHDSAVENKAFWDTITDIWLKEDLPVPDSVLGDLNVLEESIDRFPHRLDEDGATEALSRFKRLLELKDGWRATNPDLKAYTYTYPTRSHSRIDCILVSPSLFKSCRNWDVAVKTDHRMASVNICAPGRSQGAPQIAESFGIEINQLSIGPRSCLAPSISGPITELANTTARGRVSRLS